jgi:flavorubredoxin
MKAVPISKGIYWVGGIDWNVRNFHGYLTPKGTTYNAYLIIDEKITLVDTVKHYLHEELLERISSVIDPSKIDYIVVNHVEMDHSGALPYIMSHAPKAKIVISQRGEKGLKAHFRDNWDYIVVKSGDTLNTGGKTLSFIHTPMVHWPDNMLTYLPNEKLLFSNDAFGQHIASPERFDDEYGLDILLEAAGNYYSNIVLPYGEQVKKALESASKLQIDMIAPSHGLIWRKHIPEILKSYAKWSGNETENKCVIVFDSMYGSTGKIADAISSAFEEKGITPRLMDLKASHHSEVMPEILTAKYICVGSSTLNNNMLPTVASFLTYMKGLSPKNRIGLAFGSYGWGGQSIGQINEILEGMGFKTLEQIKLNYIPAAAELNEVISKVSDELSALATE